jgi:hypothetical protein
VILEYIFALDCLLVDSQKLEDVEVDYYGSDDGIGDEAGDSRETE